LFANSDNSRAAEESQFELACVVLYADKVQQQAEENGHLRMTLIEDGKEAKWYSLSSGQAQTQSSAHSLG
jgi:hypothetical protein